MTRIDVINTLIEKNGYKSYLEIGVQKGECFNEVKCAYKVGVDPDPKSKAKFCMTSDEYFERYTKMYDIIFIDGLHEADQVYKDIYNSLNVLHKFGTIVCHDMLPKSEAMQRVPRSTRQWTGDCWKAWVRVRSERPDLKMITLNCDFGCGIIQRTEHIHESLPVKEHKLTFDNFQRNKYEWMNIVDHRSWIKSL